MKKKGSLLVILALVFLTGVVFRKYFFKGQIPFPSNLLVSFYSPWKNYQWGGYPNGPPNKPIGFDVIKLFYPFREFTIEQFKGAQWPLWNPYNFSGNIHLATYQSAVFYPLNLLYFVLPLIDAWSWLVILQPILTGFFMHLFLKEIGLSKKASFFGALVFAFSGRMLAWMEESLVIEHSFLWLPLILCAVERIGKKIKPTNVALFVFGITASILAGFLQMTLYVLATVLAWIVFRYWGFKRKDFKKLTVLGLGLFFSFLLSAVHVWPAIEAYFHSPRGLVNAKFLFDQYLMRPWHLITFLAPDFWGNPGAYNHFGKGFYHEKVIFIGIPALLLALFALKSRLKNSKLRFFKWLSLITLSLGFFPLGWVLYYSRLPLFSVMMPARIFFLSTFGFCVLAAFGVDVYFKHRVKWKDWKGLVIILSSVLVMSWLFVPLCWFFISQKGAMISLRNLILPTGFFASSIIIILAPWLKDHFSFLKKLNENKAKFLSLGGLTALSIFSSFYFANKFLYFSERKFVFPEVGVITELKEVAGIDRVWSYGDGCMEKNMNIYYGLYSPEGYDALFSQRYGELLHSQKTKGEISSQITRTDAEIQPASEGEEVFNNWYRRRLLSLLGVKYIFETKLGDAKDLIITEEERFPPEFFQFVWEDQSFKIWEYQEALPRAFLVNDYLIETDKQKIVDHLFDKDFDLGKKIILEKEPGLEIKKEEANEKESVEIIEYTPNQVSLETEALAPALLFLSDNYYPGWKATIDGKKAEILRADYSFRALALSAGKHQIVFSYEPGVFYWGLRVSIFSLILFIVWLFFVKIRTRKR